MSTGPPRLLPMLAGATGVPGDAGAYQFEPKFDGQRLLATVEPAGVTLTTRLGRETTATYPELAGLAAALCGRSAVVDGEVVAFDAEGRSAFQRLQRRMHVAQPPARLVAEVPAVFVAFDVLWLDGALLIDRPQSVRRAALHELRLQGPAWQTSPVLDASPDDLLDACRQLGLEGFMAKQLNAPYLPGRRSSAWSKVKCGHRREFVVAGWLPGKKGRSGSIGSLALGCYDVAPEVARREGRPQQLQYMGQVGSGLTEELIDALRRLFAGIARPSSPFAPGPLPRGLVFVDPVLTVEVAYNGVTDSCTLRQPSLKGIRTDIPPDDVVFDDELSPSSQNDRD